jgi:putative transposase
MVEYRTGSHTIYDIKYHIVWVTKYRYEILSKAIIDRLIELLLQGCASIGVTVIKGGAGKDHVHMLISCPTHIAPSKIVQYLKGRSSKLIQDEFPELKKRYWGQHLWATGYFCATVGAVTDETIKQYIENQDKHHNKEVFKIEE